MLETRNLRTTTKKNIINPPRTRVEGLLSVYGRLLRFLHP